MSLPNTYKLDFNRFTQVQLNIYTQIGIKESILVMWILLKHSTMSIYATPVPSIYNKYIM